MYISHYVKYRLLLSRFNETYVLSTYFIKNTQISKLFKIRPVGAEFFLADRRTDGRTNGHDEAVVVFWQICESGHKLRQNYQSYSVPCSQSVPRDRSFQVLPKFFQNPQTNSAKKAEQGHKFFLPYSH